MPSQFFDKNKRIGVKTEQLKILTRPDKNKGNKNIADSSNTPFSRELFFFCFVLFFFLTMKGNLFSFMARISIPTVLLGHQDNDTFCSISCKVKDEVIIVMRIEFRLIKKV